MLGRLSRPPEEVRSEHLRHWTSTIAGTVRLGDLTPRSRVRVAGVVQNIRIDPRAGRGYVEATIVDGTGYLVARWLGRSSLLGIRLGIGLVVEGIVGTDRDGTPVILNPEYDIVPGPEHG